MSHSSEKKQCLNKIIGATIPQYSQKSFNLNGQIWQHSKELAMLNAFLNYNFSEKVGLRGPVGIPDWKFRLSCLVYKGYEFCSNE